MNEAIVENGKLKNESKSARKRVMIAGVGNMFLKDDGFGGEQGGLNVLFRRQGAFRHAGRESDPDSRFSEVDAGARNDLSIRDKFVDIGG